MTVGELLDGELYLRTAGELLNGEQYLRTAGELLNGELYLGTTGELLDGELSCSILVCLCHNLPIEANKSQTELSTVLLGPFSVNGYHANLV
jgi:hypothetical protein